jgi:membrane-associated phospholipid phosphatase
VIHRSPTERRGRVALLHRIREVPGSNLTEDFRSFLSPSRRMSGYYLKIRPRPLSFKSFPLHHLLIALSFAVAYSKLLKERR